jgi:catechol 2,3-dioxygenase-like lactoylglutathione lyase family enzyme
MTAISIRGIETIRSITLEVTDPAAANAFYTDAFGLDAQLGFRAVEAPPAGFPGFTLSLVVSGPGTVDHLIDRALDRGATPLKPAKKGLWGYGGVVQAPDGTIWKVATTAKQDSGPVTGQIDQIVLLLGSADVSAAKQFYVERGLAVAKSFPRVYAEFDMPSSPIKLALYRYRALAKDAGVPPEASASHRLSIQSNTGSFSDPDGFTWDAAAALSQAA